MIRFLVEMLLKESELSFFFFLEILSALNFIVLQNHAELSEVNCRDKPAAVSLRAYASFELSEVYRVLFASTLFSVPIPEKFSLPRFLRPELSVHRQFQV